jgi:uncharacterized Zn finger protein
MTDQAERVAVACPGCSPGEPTAHEVLSTGGGLFTAKCGECGQVHKEEPPRRETVDRTVVVSQDGESTKTTLAMPTTERVAIGDEFVVDTPEAILGVRVTAIEVGPEERVDAAAPGEIETVWTRAIDNVSVPVTVHPSDGRRDEMHSTVESWLADLIELTDEAIASNEFQEWLDVGVGRLQRYLTLAGGQV